MRKGTPEQIAQRREEIINACEQLYQTTSFREITLKEIGKITSFSRPTIYNYFETKEEIFLALFKREYDRWNEQLTAIHDQNERLTKAQLADKIAQSLADRPQLLKLLGGQQPRGTSDIFQALLRQVAAPDEHAAHKVLPEYERDGYSELHLYLLSLHVRNLPVYFRDGEAEGCHEGSRNRLCVSNRVRIDPQMSCAAFGRVNNE